MRKLSINIIYVLFGSVKIKNRTIPPNTRVVTEFLTVCTLIRRINRARRRGGVRTYHFILFTTQQQRAKSNLMVVRGGKARLA